MNRRTFVRKLAGTIAAAAILRRKTRAESRASGSEIKAVAFDGFAIFDPRPVVKRVIEQVPEKGAEFANLWRMRQFEYSWLRTTGENTRTSGG